MQRRQIILAGAGLMGAIACSNRQARSRARSILSEMSDDAATPIVAIGTGTSLDPAQYLKQLPAPKFKRGHTLPPLTRFGWTLPFDSRVELADRWGYALEWGPYATVDRVASALGNPQSEEAKVMALAAANPKRYQLAVILSPELPTTPDAIWLRNERGELLDGKKIWSPEAPLAALQAAAKLRSDPLKQIRSKAPISVVLNGGEYGLTVLGGIQKSCERDPQVVSARRNRDWFEYISARKAYQESFITKAVRQAVPDRQMYVYYPADSNPHRGRYGGWEQWCYDYKYMRKISDRPSSSTYFKEFNTGWTGNMDILTQVLNSVGQQIKFGDPLSYNWVCSGWMRGKDPVFGEIDRYIGFLKCYYMAGNIGSIAGYFDFPTGGFEISFNADRPPNWLLQMVALSRVHAIFSHLENYLRQGDLLPGPMKHVWSKDTPAYEFPTKDPDIRVLARKHRNKANWSIVAWAAGGNSRQATIDIPQLGRVDVTARPNGSVYTAKRIGDFAKLIWVDRQDV
ncbi:hypothetical protein [Chamaesiphon minutus]|uniref:Uncharacterized protein n=1 Tax=Chamaesiphon minutus (strain ATCC 27169 / PCC 6605) TaxID=1173020 RepID=K9UL85_CHAP6|nr:hypothetical protein [Chamaesiphon minutus]AFY95590.1 hypothetical protein Cha6605_4672 [Chamaesiphon minutus PCC 6605]